MLAITKKTILCCILLFAATSATNLRGLNDLPSCNNDPNNTCSAGYVCSGESNTIFSEVYNGLKELDWDMYRIDEAVRTYWNTDWSFLEWYINYKGENVTILTTACCHTAPFIISTLLKLQTRPYPHSGLYRLPQNPDLVLYNNIPYPHSELPKPPVQGIRDFISSRPSDESVLIQVDLCRVFPEGSYLVSDHHFMIHAYNGQINVYHSWQNLFTVVDWMTDHGSFDTRYPMAQATFFDHLETLLGPGEGEDDQLKRRQEAAWAILGRTPTIQWKVRPSDGKEVIDDVVVRHLQHTWVVTLATHWPNDA